MRASPSVAILVALLAGAVASVSRAAEPTPSGAPGNVGAGDEKEARRLFQKAELSFNLGKFEEALADYQAAYQAKPLSGFLFNIAQCYRNLGNWERARFFYRRYLTLEPRSPNRHRVDDLVAEMTDKLDKQQAQAATTPAPAGAPAPSGPPSTAPPAAPAPMVVEPVMPLTLATAAVSEVPPGATSSDGATTLVTSPPPEPERRPVYKRWWFWGGVGAVVVGGAVAAFVLTRPTTKTPGTLDPIDSR